MLLIFLNVNYVEIKHNLEINYVKNVEVIGQDSKNLGSSLELVIHNGLSFNFSKIYHLPFLSLKKKDV